MKIRVRETDDLDEVNDLDKVCLPMDARLTESELSSAHWWLATSGKEAVGYAGIQPIEQDGALKGYLLRAGVLPEARGLGLQKRMIQARVAWARRSSIPRVYSHVVFHNLPSMRSLLACGFTPYYCTEHSLYLEKKLK